MKNIGIIGGLSWQSTAQYYEHINQEVNDKLGGFHSAKINLHSLNFSEIVALLSQDDWPSITKKLISVAQSVEASKADFVLVANNTLHNVADDIAQAINIPLIHIADVMAAKLIEDNINNVGLLGTLPTMELGFYKERLNNLWSTLQSVSPPSFIKTGEIPSGP
jgi:aspartate racemase